MYLCIKLGVGGLCVLSRESFGRSYTVLGEPCVLGEQETNFSKTSIHTFSDRPITLERLVSPWTNCSSARKDTKTTSPSSPRSDVNRNAHYYSLTLDNIAYSERSNSHGVCVFPEHVFNASFHLFSFVGARSRRVACIYG